MNINTDTSIFYDNIDNKSASNTNINGKTYSFSSISNGTLTCKQIADKEDLITIATSGDEQSETKATIQSKSSNNDSDEAGDEEGDVDLKEPFTEDKKCKIKKKRIRRTKQLLLEEKLASSNKTLNNRIQKLKSSSASPVASLTKTIDRSIMFKNNVDKPATNNRISYIQSINQIDNIIRRRKKIYRTKVSMEKIKSKEFIEDDDEEEDDDIVSAEIRVEKLSAKVSSNIAINESTKEQIEEIDNEKDEFDDTSPSTTNLDRTCLVCDVKMHQDLLSDHCSEHYYESPKCSNCEKVSSNPSNYVTHILSHLVSQFYCVKCEKWFRQPIVFRRHQRECTVDLSSSSDETTTKKNTEISRGKRKNPSESTTSTIQENKRTRLARTASAIALTAFKQTEPLTLIKKRIGRPPKYPKTQVTEIQVTRSDEEPEEDEKEQSKDIKLPKSKRLLSKFLSQPKTQINKLRGRKKKPGRTFSSASKKSTRLSSVSSNGSSSLHSSNGNNSVPVSKNQNQLKTKQKQLNMIDYENEDDITNQSNNFEDIDEDISDQVDDIDDIVVSDYEMDDNNLADNNNSKSVSAPVALKQETALRPSNTNLSLTATYKVKIQIRRPSNNALNNSINTSINSKQKENESNIYPFRKNNEQIESVPLTPIKSTISNNNLFVLNTPTATPSKTNTVSNALNSNQNESNDANNQNGNVTTYFECPECDKKFVSQYGLFQHYDHHPTLAVTCSMCQITFDNHHVLILHYKSAHNITAKEKPENTINTAIKQQSKKSEIKTTKSLKQSIKAKQLIDEIPNVDASVSTDLSALPSIMTRTSRMTNNSHTNSAKPSLITAAALLNHSLKYKTSGFADLSFIDFSCVNFPRIAQNFCELWPRKIQTSEFNSQLQQPLHNYMCNKCGFYFPCKASLVLHKTNKLFASSKLKTCTKTESIYELSKDENKSALNKNKITSRCQLFMTNSKYLCYEKCLDEIITKIENADTSFKNKDKQESENQTNEFLKSFDLVHKKTLPVSNEPSNNRKYLNLIEKMMIKLRQQMLDINHQFIIDLDRWKFMHSTASQNSLSADSNSEQSNDYFHDSNKIHLKPHVNLNRPLLIRSKKLKRNGSKLNAISLHYNSHIKKNNNNSRPHRTQQKQPQQQLTTFQSILNAINSVNITSTTSTSNKNVPKLESNTLKHKNASSYSNSTNASIPKLSKPFFSATSGNFSAASINSFQSINNGKPKQITPNIMLAAGKKRKLQIEKRKRVLEKKRKEKEEEVTVDEDGDEQEENESSESEKVEDENDTEKEEVIEEEDNDIQVIDDDEDKPVNNNKSKMTQQKNNRNENNITIVKRNPPPLLCQQRRIAGTIPVSSRTSFPPPPPLYKAPTSSNNLFNSSSANSSILANASGMNNNLTKASNNNNGKNMSMPKLQPAGSNSINNLQLANSNNYASLMPKLKPSTYSSNNQSRNKQLRPSLPPPPPLTLMGFNPAQQQKNQDVSDIAQKQMPTLKQFQNKPTQSLSTNPGSSPTHQSSILLKTVKSLENLSLKCKFCFKVFKGQSEFFQHVIVSHPKMLEQRLNRPTSKSNDNSNTNSNSSNISSISSNNNSQDTLFRTPTTSTVITSGTSSIGTSK